MPHKGDEQLANRDKAIPGLKTIFDPTAFPKLIGRAIGMIPNRAEINYVRYKPGTNCLVSYKVMFGDAEHLVYAKSYSREQFIKLEKWMQTPTADSPVSEKGVYVFDDLGIALSLFPNDRKIEQIKRLRDESYRSRFSNKLLDGDNAWTSGDLQTLRYKPERRFVAKLDTINRCNIVKVYAAESDYQKAKKGALLLSAAADPSCPRLHGHSHRFRALVFEYINGTLLTDLMSSDAPDFEIFASVGKALAAFHRTGYKGLTKRDATTLQSEMNATSSLLTHLMPHLKVSVQRIHLALTELLEASPMRQTLIHGDFYADQIIIRNDEPVILDLDEAALGEPAIDLGNFVAHLEMAAGSEKIPLQRVEEIRKSFCNGYRSNDGFSINEEQLNLYTLIALFNLTTRPFRVYQQNWAFAIDRIVNRIAELLYECRTPKSFAGKGSASEKHTTRYGDFKGTSVDSINLDKPESFTTSTLEVLLRQRQELARKYSTELGVKKINVLRNKPGRRSVVALEIADGESRFETLIGKIRVKGSHVKTFAVQKWLWTDGFGPASSAIGKVPEPVAIVPEMNMSLQEYVSGKDGFSVLTGRDSIQAARRIATAIFQLHSSRPPNISNRVHTVDAELSTLKDRLERTAKKQSQWRRRLDDVYGASSALECKLSVNCTNTIHRDFYPDQVILARGKVYLLDLDLVCQGDPALDIGNYLAHITEFGLRIAGDGAAFAAFENAFVEHYTELAGQEMIERVEAYKTLSIARHIYLSTQFEERKKTTRNLIEICEERLSIEHKR